MKKSNLRSASKKPRNGKVSSKKKNSSTKNKSTVKTKNDNPVSFLRRTSNNLNPSLVVNSKNNSHEISVNKNCGNLVGCRELVILLKKIPPSIITRVSFDNQTVNSKNSNKNCYTNLEDYIQLNEVQIYNELKPMNTNTDSISKKTKRAILPSKSLKKHTDLKATIDHPEMNKTLSDTRITRGKSILLQTEERKQLDQMIFNKFPENTFKMFAVQLDDFTEEVKFLSNLGLTCRFKCKLSTRNVKKKKT